jgi:hypothetical protein
MNLVFIICSTKAFGERQIDRRLGVRTKLNQQLGCQAYICRSYEEFETLQEQVKKPGKGLWCLVREQQPDGRLLKPGFSPPAPAPAPPIEPRAPFDPAPFFPPPPIDPLNPDRDLMSEVVAQITDRPRKLAELAAHLQVDPATLKPLIAESKLVRLKQGGWVTLTE